MPLLRTLLCAWGVILFAGSAIGQSTATHNVFSFEEVAALAERDPAAAVSMIDTLLSGGAITDPRLVFDLLLTKAELWAAAGNPAAAKLYFDIARYVERNRSIIDWDPIVFYEEAAELHFAAQNFRAATASVTRILTLEQDGGQPGTQIAQTYYWLAEIARAAGSDEDAARHANSAADARTQEPPTRDTGDKAGGFTVQKVFYATDRAQSGYRTWSGKTKPTRFYGNERGTLELGIAEVTIPYSHTSSVIESPSIFRLQFGPNSAKHIVLRAVTPIEADAYFAEMNATLHEMGSSDAFVFIHGYNVTFDAAAKRAAQISHDIDFPGIPILYSWPSKGKAGGYLADTAVVRLSGRRLARFLEDLLDRSNATTIHIVAHSMGNRALTDALELLALRRDIDETATPLFGQILFAAPDVDSDLFQEMMPTIQPIAERLTLYASRQDWALAASRRLHGKQPRAGQGGDDILVRDEFDSVDMSELGDDMLAHSYFADDSSALADMAILFWRNVAPNRRCGLKALELQSAEIDKPIWNYVAGSCRDRDLVELLSHLRQRKVTDAETAKLVVAENVNDAEIQAELEPVIGKLFEE